MSGLDWAACRALLDERVPGAVAQAIKDADTFFGVELPGLTQWTFGAEQAAAIHQPVLSVLGSDTATLWVEVAEFLRSSVPDVEERTIDGVGHLLHIQRPEPVAEQSRTSSDATRSELSDDRPLVQVWVKRQCEVTMPGFTTSPMAWSISV